VYCRTSGRYDYIVDVAAATNLSTDYYDHLLHVLDTALDKVAAYKAWHVFDPGREYPVDDRYSSLPATTKQDIRGYFPDGMVSENELDLPKISWRFQKNFETRPSNTKGSPGRIGKLAINKSDL
jgi:hypothetical protein